jgi:endonuclease/exonuclease/phosphatase family metal-dependent hydrolase
MSLRLSRTSGQALVGRRLHFESLERRELLAVMRIVDWNTLNGPNDATGDANFQTVLQAIGNETVQGNTQRIDILALEETDNSVSGGNSIGRIESVMDTLYPSTNYSSVVTALDGGGDATGFVYDTSTVSLLESVTVGSGTLTHNVMRAKFHPVGTSGDSDFYVYSIHLKSGTTASDATQRGTEASFLRADADSLGDGTHVIFVGDFNMHGSSEAAYVNIVAPGDGQVLDVADAPGEWTDNAAFKIVHSQDPQTTMDDRFDIQFASGEFFDGTGLEYVGNSYHVFGNNGTHALNQPITTGTGASPTVLNALVAASDHLPVVADYQMVVSTPNVRVTETLSGTRVIEGGLYDTYHVVLDTVPAANVSVTVTPNSQLDIGNGAGVAKVLTFTPANALTPQTIIVTAVNDVIGEGTQTALITHSSASADAAYGGISVASVNTTIIDNDAPTIVINELDSDTPSTDTAEFIELYDGGVGNISLTGYVVVFFNGGMANNPSYLTLDLTGKQTDAQGFFLLGNSGVTPTPGLTFNNNTLQNGPDGVGLYFGVAASSIPNGTLPTAAVLSGKLKDAIVYDAGTVLDDDADLRADLNPGHPLVYEHQNGNVTGHSNSRVPDGSASFDTSLYVQQIPTPGTYNTARPFGVEMLQSGSRIDVAEGGVTDSYQLALLSTPTADVQITIDPDNQADLGTGGGAAIVLTFTPANALIPQTITVTAVDDAAVEGLHTSLITHSVSSVDGTYNGFSIPNVVANIIDNDVPAVPSLAISELMYNPASDEVSPGVAEWIEIVNTGNAAVDLSGWKFDDEDATNWGAIPNGTVLNSHQVAVVFDSDFTNAATFRSEWSVPFGALVVGVTWGSLSNSPAPGNEVIKLLDSGGAQMDAVNYDDTNPWPGAADGPSIYLTGLALDNNSGTSWARSTTAVKAWSPAGPTFSTSDVASPGWVFVPADYSHDESTGAGDFVMWRKTLGAIGPALPADGSGAIVGVPNNVVDQFDYTYWQANYSSALFPGSGSGAGSGAMDDADANASALVAATNTSEPASQASTTAPAVDAAIVSAAPPVKSMSNSAVDAAVADLALLSPPVADSVIPSIPIRQPGSSFSAAHSSNLLLSLSKAELLTQPNDDVLMAAHESENDGCEVDEFVASLESDNLVANLGHLSLML